MASPRRSIELRQRRPDAAALVKRIAGGDESALATLYDATCDLIFGLLLRILDNSETAEQVLVDVYKEVWEQAAAHDGEREDPLTWLIMLARRRAIVRLRAEGHNPGRQASLLKTAGSGLTAAPETAGFTSEQRRIVRSAFSALRPVEQQMIELAYYSGLRRDEIAARVGLSVQSVRAGIRAGMKGLRDAFEFSPSPR
jgi:RNA polymerase sigma-70 factor (ECF subfamily)